MFDTLDISASALTAERTRMHVIANNMANVNTTLDENGEVNPFRRRLVYFARGMSRGNPNGVRVDEVRKQGGPLRQVFDPGHPEANPDGYRLMPNVKPIVEMVDMMEASRAYEGNLTVMETTKSLAIRALSLLA